MHIDIRKLKNNTSIEGDICIIGAGTAGISIALDWMHTSQKVILLEGGGLNYDPQVQDLYEGETSGQPYFPLRACRLHYFGGTTGHWAGMCAPFDPIDFKKRDWVPNSGWPITLSDLHPFYARANKTLQLGPYEYGFDYWQKELSDLNSYPLDNSVIYNKMWQYSTARFNSLYKETILKAKNIHLYSYANVTNIKGNEGLSSIDEVEVKNHSGKTHTVKAKHFILACGAIQNARILLASNKQAVRGLGNDKDNVGRYFMEHLEVGSSEVWLLEPFKTNLYHWNYGETKASAELAITEEVQRQERILNGTASFSRLAYARIRQPRIKTWTNKDPRKALESTLGHWRESAAKAAEITEGPITRAFELQTRIEQAPNPNSRVTLLSEKDALGVPKPHLHWEMTELDKRSVRRIHQLIAEQMAKSGVGRVKIHEFLRDEEDNFTWPEGTNGGWHHMGTCRMSDDPTKGVVDANCQVHGIENLYVAGSACYTTSGAPNPTLTLVALSLRLSDFVKSKV